jgi:muconate cycloisomerase
MADESAWNATDILELHNKQAAECFSCYVTKPGGLWRAKQQAEVGNTVGMYSDIGGSIEFGIGTAANLHLGVALERAILPSVVSVTTVAGEAGPSMAGVYYLDDIVATPFTFRDGVLLAPDGPGLGIEVDEEKVRHYAESSAVA